jgi:hypothetical protein
LLDGELIIEAGEIVSRGTILTNASAFKQLREFECEMKQLALGDCIDLRCRLHPFPWNISFEKPVPF